MVFTRSQRRAADESSSASLRSPAPSSHIHSSNPLPPRYVERSWQQQCLKLQKQTDTADGSPSTSTVSCSPIISADDRLQLTCRFHSNHMREFIVTSSGPLITSFDFLLLFLTLLILLYRTVLLYSPFLSLPTLLFLFPLLLRLFSLPFNVHSESLLCTSNLGLQLSTHYAFGRSSHRFIDAASIESIVINEGIERWTLVDVLTVIVRKRGGVSGKGWVEGRKLVVVFEQLRPRLCVLRKVYRGVRSVMYDEEE